ncbi:HNH endonuclease [Arthrobacter koreensis]|uniref:HNH endonuclease n=1 Tax=Arthrobacter koreensis TaxID=199136 RepID=UPI00159ED4CD|nr:HNH endonuclease signature motif containing protein [Arthrobacter koreensis]
MAVFHAEPGQADTTDPGPLPEGFTGQLSLRGPETLGYDETVSTLQRLGILISWAQAQHSPSGVRSNATCSRQPREGPLPDFGRRARRLRESRFPDLIPVRHRQAKNQRRVMFQPLPDGMSCLSAIIAAEKGQAMFAALTSAAKAGKHAGDPRTMDQLRADTLTELLLENQPPTSMRETQAAPGTRAGSDNTANEPAPDPVPTPTPTAAPAPGPSGNPLSGPAGNTQPGRRPRRAERHRTQNRNRSTVRTEVMVLINADTLAGLDENPAELNGYGPISAETARAMILDALHWTPLIQDPATGHILTVGRTRRIPSGLKRWLQARDGTCRFPGCSVSVTHAEIDHTKPFSRGGATEHANLEHLCPKHHRFKTLGHWTARQPEPGTIEWHSPTGRTYATDPALDYQPNPPTRTLPELPPRPGPQTQHSDDEPPPF